ncbi:MAG TPA: glycosyltransferase [Kofleriaceae bacterium]|nr:glycosyltransferase [Kofleriaceae bacterium]
MKLLARDNRVLWMNSISTRTPSLTSGRDLGKIVNKLKSFAKGPMRVEGQMDVYTPIVLPFPHNPLAVRLNQQILRGSVSLLRRNREMRDFQLWSFIPSAAKYIGKLGESLVVYYCTDEWSHFSSVDRDKTMELERELCQRADIVFTTATTLLETKRLYNPETHLALHGVDQAHFARALLPTTELAPELRDVKPPVIGFVGLIQDWVDVELIRYMAERHHDWTFVLVGKALVDVSPLERLSNVRLLGRKPYEALPSYLKAFDVGIIPFVLNELTRNVNPIKLREYLSAGLPVVSTDIPEVARYVRDQGNLANACTVATTHDDFLAGVERALDTDSREARLARSEAMLAETWERKVHVLGEHIHRVRAKRGSGYT